MYSSFLPGGGAVAGEMGMEEPSQGRPRGWGRGCADRHRSVRQIQRGGREARAANS